ncbi:MAG: hypothetical protein IPL46_27815 [Saprospiraceae bacterium]|nr:hypothetical protein [Saprospiraceae bacterium]
MALGANCFQMLIKGQEDGRMENGKWKMENWEGYTLNGNILDNGQDR